MPPAFYVGGGPDRIAAGQHPLSVDSARGRHSSDSGRVHPHPVRLQVELHRAGSSSADRLQRAVHVHQRLRPAALQLPAALSCPFGSSCLQATCSLCLLGSVAAALIGFSALLARITVFPLKRCTFRSVKGNSGAVLGRMTALLREPSAINLQQQCG